nr:hypothetical protein [Tanacetum cinerariifolium]
KDKDEDPFARSDRGLKKRKTRKDDEPTKGLKAKESNSISSKGTKSQSKSSKKSAHAEELEVEVADSEMPQDQEENISDDDVKPKRKAGQHSNFLKAHVPILLSCNITLKNVTKLSKKLDWENPEGGDYPFDLTKPLPLVMNGNHQIVPVDYFFNSDLKYLQGGILTMTYTKSITKTKATQCDLPGFEDMVPNIWSPVKVAYDKHALWGISYWRDQCKTFYGVESYQKKINVTKPETTKPDVMKKDPYTSYQDPQGFIYVDNKRRNRLMRSDELYKFSNGTLIRLQTLLDDITKNILMEYLPQRRWSTLEKKKSHIMIKAIDKQLKEKRMMRSFGKFIGGRHYGTDLRLLQQTI